MLIAHNHLKLPILLRKFTILTPQTSGTLPNSRKNIDSTKKHRNLRRVGLIHSIAGLQHSITTAPVITVLAAMVLFFA